jgi:hypothetical protein
MSRGSCLNTFLGFVALPTGPGGGGGRLAGAGRPAPRGG